MSRIWHRTGGKSFFEYVAGAPFFSDACDFCVAGVFYSLLRGRRAGKPVIFVTFFFAFYPLFLSLADATWRRINSMNYTVKIVLRGSFRLVIARMLALSLLFVSGTGEAQIRDSIPTGYLPDAAEEYWPARGFFSAGGNFREVYELFDNYLWGRGPQDNNGYFLHRAIVHGDFRCNSHFRAFVQLQSSFISGRNGGARPVQDLDKLAVDQLFGEYSFRSKSQHLFSVRFGKQALNYGVGSLLDIRETNVRRSFFGGKFIVEHKNTKVDFFAMELMHTNPGFFDDRIDRSQKIAGLWATQTFPGRLVGRLDAYYLYNHRDSIVFSQGAGTEDRHTVGAALSLLKDRWSGYTEADVQLGEFNDHSILAWKLTQTLTYQFSNTSWKPALSIQSAMSSGDHNLQDRALNTFDPIYPKAIYYGFIDNAGSANLFLLHGKIDVQPVTKLKLTASYYSFWRQSTVDGLYGANGYLLVSSNNDSRRVGSMVDIVLLYTVDTHFSLRGIVTYYKRGPFLKREPTTPHDIRYLGVAATLRI